MLKNGIYEQVVNSEISKSLEGAVDQVAQTAPIDQAESSKVLSTCVTEVSEKG